MSKLKIGYFADGQWSHQAVQKILLDDSLKLVFICARYDAPDPILKEIACKFGIDFITNANINSYKFIEKVSRYSCDLFISMSFNQIFRHEMINLTNYKIINCHAGRLPFYRGRNILNWALINDEKEFAVTVHFVDEGIDTGDIILQRSYSITDNDDYSTLLARAYDACAENLYNAIKLLQSGNQILVKQQSIHKLGFYCTARKDGDERLDWNQRSRDVYNFVRAICRPGPEARTDKDNNELKINKVKFLVDAPVYKGVIGAIVGFDDEGFFC